MRADHSNLSERLDTLREPSVGFVNWLASLPSPSSGSLTLGPLTLNAYGLMIALGAIAGTWLMGKRLEAHGTGTRDDASAIAMIAVPAGIIGARLYHVITDWERFDGRLLDVVKIWKGGLGIWGGVAAGVVVGVCVAKRRGGYSLQHPRWRSAYGALHSRGRVVYGAMGEGGTSRWYRGRVP